MEMSALFYFNACNMLDLHAHLYMSHYDDDRNEVVKRAFDTGLTHIISVSTEADDHAKALTMTLLNERIFASLGLHPHYFNDHCKDEKQLENDIEIIRTLAAENKKVIAIGECGLDYFNHSGEVISDAQKAWQKTGLKAQIQLAKELHVPMIIHCRDAYEDLFEIMRADGHDIDFILHCYMGDTDVTKKFLTLSNAYFSFTGNITYAVKKVYEGTKDDSAKTVKLIPLERIFMETDSPFLAPVPHRGKRNEPSFVVEVAKKIAGLHDVSIDVLEQVVEKNMQRVFKI